MKMLPFTAGFIPGRMLTKDNLYEWSSKTMICIAISTIVLGAWAQRDQIEGVLDRLTALQWGIAYLAVARTLFVINVAALFWRFYLVLFYKPARTCTDSELPTCTVIIPAYNEGRHVADTIDSVAASDYPVDKLQIIAVDDGSADDTWEWIQQAAARYPQLVTPLRLKRNSGKRKALYEGFIRSQADIVVTIDSDSIIEKNTLRNLVSPFITQSNVGAVAGNVRVLNRHQGFIPKMLDVSFAFSFDFIRASQSQVDSVLCTPGALSAYRRDLVMKVLRAWMNQRFLGQKSNIGEDRAMTNLILKQGFAVKFQSNAVVFTQVPVRYKGLCKMFLRWARSNIRETIEMARFVFKPFRTNRLGAQLNFLHSVVNLFGATFMIFGTLGCILWEPQAFLAQILLGAELMAIIPGTFYALKYRSSNALWAFAYSLFWLAGLFWISPYALLTVGNNKWLTRTLPAAGTVAVASASKQPSRTGSIISHDLLPV
ncbi:MAG TPA: glycosyltransferase [Anaerohalosphaeraceae bacterium]|nr:glycosyltransferase [Anaerohalosphaeraceae bacterium]